jgi:predicted ester cyclase
MGSKLPTSNPSERGCALSVEENKAIIRRFVEVVFNQKQPELIEQFLADGWWTTTRSSSPSPTSPAAWRRVSGCCSWRFPTSRRAVKHQVAEDDYVSVHLMMTGTNTGSYPRVPEPTERHTEWESMVLFRMEDGKIAELWGTSDRMGMLTKLGILPDIG